MEKYINTTGINHIYFDDVIFTNMVNNYLLKKEEILLNSKIKNGLVKRKTDALKNLSPNELLRFMEFFDDDYKISKKWKG